MRIVFMGTPDFALPALSRLIADQHEVVAVYCQPDKPQGRHFTLTAPPVKTLALAHGIEVRQPATLKDAAAQRELADFAPELIVVAAYGKILPKAVLDLPKWGCINVHGSLLPLYRGAAPIQWAVIHNQPTSGVTIMKMAEGLDTGDMLLKRETPIQADETAGELFERIALIGADALSTAIEQLESLLRTAVAQEDALACWAPPLQKSHGEILWDRPATEIFAQIRGVTPWPGAYTFLNGKRLKIHKAALHNTARPEAAEASGRVIEIDPSSGDPIVGCGNGALQLIEVQLEGSRRITGAEFVRGQRMEADGKIFLGSHDQESK